VRVRFTDPDLGDRTVTGKFNNNLQEVLSVVCNVVHAHCSFRDSVVRIEPCYALARGCGLIRLPFMQGDRA